MAVTADHGNCEQVVDPVSFQPVYADFRGMNLRPGILADIAPTLLKVMGRERPQLFAG
ncbi:MAG: hypothetical protein RL653_712 [Pseudomonadota bacterium]|jgi:2,3-bisphosphoglycerate-independent phosphoglycerate mutase